MDTNASAQSAKLIVNAFVEMFLMHNSESLEVYNYECNDTLKKQLQ